jgi:hypothetical protein
MSADPDFAGSSLKKRGRPVGSLKLPLTKAFPNVVAARKAKIERQNFLDKHAGMSLRTRCAKVSPALNYKETNLSPPDRSGHILSTEIISIAIRIIIILIREYVAGKVVSTKNIFGRAEEYLDIGHTKLRELWHDYESVKGAALPPSFSNQKQIERMKKVGKQWFGPLREEIYRIRHEEGRAVEVPTLIKWFRETHNISINKRELTYRLVKMGFVFGKMHKLCIRREADDVTKKRRIYLKKRMEYDNLIHLNKVQRAQWIQNKCIGPIPPELVYVYLDESYVNRNHSLGMTWWHPDDPTGSTGSIPTGKGERLVLLTAIGKDYGIFGDLESLETLMLFQAKKGTGDYHDNMDSDMFCRWLELQLFPVLRRQGIQAILVMDNASYHGVPAPGSINIKSMTKKSDVTEHLDRYNVPYRAGRAPHGDTLEQLKEILKAWLKENAAAHNLLVGVTRVEALCKKHGHFKPLMTPPYHPELQPIEKLWRDVKMFVARQFAGTRSMKELEEHVKTGFRKYGTAQATKGKMEDIEMWEQKYKTKGVYADVIDLTTVEESDDEVDFDEDDNDSDDDDDSDEE